MAIREQILQDLEESIRIFEKRAKITGFITGLAFASDTIYPLEDRQRVLETLASDWDYKVRRDVAEHPDTPPECLSEMARNDYQVRSTIAENPNTPQEALVFLARNGDVRVKAAVARNRHTPPNVLSELAGSEDVFVVTAVMNNPNTPTQLAEELSTQDEIRIAKSRREAMNEYLKEMGEIVAETQSELDESSDDREYAKILLKSIRESGPFKAKSADEIRRQESTMSTVSLETLIKISGEPYWMNRASVTEIWNLPANLIITLLGDIEPRIWMRAVKLAKFFGWDVLTCLYEDIEQVVPNSSIGFKAYYLDRENLTPGQLSELARDSHKEIRLISARNPNTEPNLLAALARDKAKSVREAAQSNRNTPH